MEIAEINVSDGTFKTIGKHEWFELGMARGTAISDVVMISDFR